ncbi:MAG: hypothetical protein ALAOOOJD_04113 [bacterium]|nr:hypothetical protein [bacterium]
MRTNNYRRFSTYCLLGFVLLALPGAGRAQRISDFKMGYSRITIQEARLEKVGTLATDFYRHNFELEVGAGQAFIGLTYHYATKKRNTKKLGNTFGKTEDGLMLTTGYNLIFSNRLRLDTYGRLRIWGDTNPAQALYATETDVRLKLFIFDADGTGIVWNNAVFPSAYVGVDVNKFGRVQALAGAGIWWNGIGLSLSAFNAFNGVDDVLNPGKDRDRIFANLRNSGISVGVSYEFHNFMLWARQNYALRNGGDDLTVSMQYQKFFPRRGARP